MSISVEKYLVLLANGIHIYYTLINCKDYFFKQKTYLSVNLSVNNLFIRLRVERFMRDKTVAYFKTKQRNYPATPTASIK